MNQTELSRKIFWPPPHGIEFEEWKKKVDKNLNDLNEEMPNKADKKDL